MRRCVSGHDACRNTALFNTSGQNLATDGNTQAYSDAAKSAQTLIDNWWNEYKNGNQGQINSFSPIP